MSLKLFFLFFVALCFVSLMPSVASANPYADRCPRHQPQTLLKAKLAKTKVFRGKTMDFTEYTLGHSGGDSRILGFVEYRELGTKFKAQFEYVDIGQGKICVKLKEIRGYFYAFPKLYMPTDYKKGSCEYSEVLRHEKRHLQALYDFHAKYTDKYRTYLGQIARSVPIPSPVASQEEVKAVQQDIIDYFMNKFWNLENKSLLELSKIQQKIDSPQEYYGVSKRCDNW